MDMSESCAMSSLLLWESPVLTAATFVPVLLFLITVQFYSLISVCAYFTLCVLGLVLASKVYWYVMVFLLKKLEHVPESDPTYMFENIEFTISRDQAMSVAGLMVDNVNILAAEIKSVILCQKLTRFIYIGVAAYILSCIGAFFNLLTLVTLAWIGAFSLPKLYELNKETIDGLVLKLQSKIGDIKGKVGGIVNKSPVKEE
eukprot:TRINITY_DN30495_c0_g1_i1.p1 TRINITY_DN30495_c0_g1~~TRINITY_DN30495_c0_g1_i1.p1  ORF type:complete len:201 (+),score=27.39 TRINITY_DN30495_c0_g1_i1:105-707(+)